ncbi:hypothetical protein F5B20DRAFT_84614 [Whalleya microplaca]|nr:hypothetical protein F5B20DRAFT_84614 [Whalleya microplaca]
MTDRQYDYSTLEVDTERNQYAEVASNQWPEVNHHADAHYNYPEVATNAGGTPLHEVKVDNTPPEVVGAAAATPTTPLKPVEESSRICGMTRKLFWGVLIGAIVVIIAIIVGVVAGVVTSRSHNSSDSSSSGQSDASTNATALAAHTKLASANFTDETGAENYLVAFQLNSGAIYLSAFNSSNNKWVVSPVVDGSSSARPLSSVKNGTALSLDVFRNNATSREIHVYWQLPAGGGFTTIASVVYQAQYDVSTTSALPVGNWENSGAGNNYVSLAGSDIVSYGKQCDYCNQYTYMYWRVGDGVRVADIENQTTGWTSDNSAINVTGLEAPSANSSLALAHAAAATANGHRSMNIFYRSTSSGLARITNGDGRFIGDYLGRDIGANTTITAFSTGYNETGTNYATPLGFQVLTMDPDASDGVQLTYWKGSAWSSAGGQVTALADCKARGVMAANHARRIYCLLDAADGDGVQIVEYRWKGDPSDTSTYGDYERVGVVSTAV